MKITLYILIALILFTLTSLAQIDKKQIREGNKLYNNRKFRESEVAYQKALKKDPKSFKASFNLGDALYKQDKFEEATKQFTDLSLKSNDKTNSSKVYHNIGNSYLLQNKFDESINAYKNALRNNPTDKATKYNLAYAQAMKKKQEQQQQNNKDQQNKDQQQQKQQQPPPEEKKNKDDKQQQPPPKDQQMSKDDADRMLQALQEEEQHTQNKAKKIQAQQGNKRGTVEKDW